MRKDFTLNSLKDSASFYNPIRVKLFYSLYAYSKDSTELQGLHNRLERGFSEWDAIIDNIITLNRAFIKLLEIAEPKAALPLIRMQTDNLKHLYAEYKYFNKVLFNIYEKGLILSQIKIKKKAINASELLTEIDDKFGDVRRIWKEYSGYIHPSKTESDSINTYYSYELDKDVVPAKYIRKFSKDMVYINQLIANVLFEVLTDITKNPAYN